MAREERTRAGTAGAGLFDWLAKRDSEDLLLRAQPQAAVSKTSEVAVASTQERQALHMHMAAETLRRNLLETLHP